MRQFRVLVNGNEYKVAIEELAEDSPAIASNPAPQEAAVQAPSSPPPKKAAPSAPVKAKSSEIGSGDIIAAMPGTILDIMVEVGDSVTHGQPLLVLEAMKMENDVMAPCDGVVKEVYAAKGASVNSGDLLMVLA